MKTLLKILGYIVFTLLMFITFIPKIQLYYFFEKELYHQSKYIITQERVQPLLLGLTLYDGTLIHHNKPVGEFKSIRVLSFLFYNQITASGLRVEHSVFNQKYSFDIDHVDVYYTVLNPMAIQIKSTGKLGDIDATLNGLDQTMILRIVPSDDMKQSYKKLLSRMRFEKGVYYYESKY